MKNKLTGEQMLNLLGLNNFNKYQQEYLSDKIQYPLKNINKPKQQAKELL